MQQQGGVADSVIHVDEFTGVLSAGQCNALSALSLDVRMCGRVEQKAGHRAWEACSAIHIQLCALAVFLMCLYSCNCTLYYSHGSIV